jgi:LysM repeat protein
MPKQWKFYSMIMLAALTLGAISGGLLALIGGSEATEQVNMAASADFSNAAFLVADDGTYAGGLLAPDSSGQVVYISANGDTITGIASRFGVSAAALAAANGMDVKEQLNGGEQLVIPAATQSPAAQSVPPAVKSNPAAPQSAASTAAKPAPVAPAQPQVAAPAPAVDAQGAYTIQPGDTLSGIAVRFGVSISDLANANGIVSLSQIYSGAKLTIPGKGQQANSGSGAVAAPPAQAPANKPAPASQPLPSQYTVQAGDNLSAIAANYGMSVDSLVSANNLTDANMIYVGQSLTIPGTSQPISKPEPVRQQPAQAQPKPAGDAGGRPSPTPSPNTPILSGAPNNRWIDVNLSTETLTAYEGDVAVFHTAVSTGIPSHPTVVGRYAIYVKYVSTLMSGPGYYLPNVPYTMYFYAGYGIHGTYWHHNFGHPMSHGCVNLPTPAAKWMFDWASVGTPVVTHY